MTRFALLQSIRIAAVAALLVAAAAPAMATQASARATAEIPFAFDLNGTNMPSGKYEFAASPFSGLVIVTDTTGRNHALLTIPLGNPAAGASGRLVFEKRGSEYRLAQIWTGGSGIGAKIAADAKKEKLARERRESPEYITVALARR